MRGRSSRWLLALLIVLLGGGAAWTGATTSAQPGDRPADPTPDPSSPGTAAGATPPVAVQPCWMPDQATTDANGRPQWTVPPAMRLEPGATYRATMDTSEGSIVFDLFASEAPLAVNNFVCLARAGFYDGIRFHRVVPGFVIQGGDPTATGRGGPGYRFADEPVTREYEPGTLAMANAGPDTNGSQFFVVLDGGGAHLQPLYTIFGQVSTGTDVVEAIGRTNPANDPATITRVTIDGPPGVAHPATPTTTQDPAEREILRVPAYEGVIVPAADAVDFYRAVFGEDSIGPEARGWAPTADDIAAFEVGLPPYLRRSTAVLSPDLWQRLPDYRRQWFGVAVEGRRLIGANLFCDPLGTEWTTSPVTVEDGGDCFFQVIYDVEAGTYSDLRVNGEA